MDPSDHRLTSSHGSQGLEGVEYGAQMQDIVRQGRMREAMAVALEGSSVQGACQGRRVYPRVCRVLGLAVVRYDAHRIS